MLVSSGLVASYDFKNQRHKFRGQFQFTVPDLTQDVLGLMRDALEYGKAEEGTESLGVARPRPSPDQDG
jgi:hypothetical protein